MTYDKTYKYWLFYIKPNIDFELPWSIRCDRNPHLLAYTDKKKFKDGFLKIHDKSKLYIEKRELNKDEVNNLAKNYQNEIIRKYNVHVKQDDYSTDQVEIYLTEHQYITAQDRCYQYMETVWKCTWDTSDKYSKSIQSALRNIGYNDMHKTLESGDSYLLLNMTPDIFGSFISQFKQVLKL